MKKRKSQSKRDAATRKKKKGASGQRVTAQAKKISSGPSGAATKKTDDAAPAQPEESPAVTASDKQLEALLETRLSHLSSIGSLDKVDTDEVYSRISLNQLSIAAPRLRFAVVGDFDAWTFVMNLPAADIEAQLPPGLELKPQTFAPPSYHPVICFAGRQHNVRMEGVDPGFCPLLEPLGLCLDYLELAAAVPYVGRTGSSTTVAHFCSTHLFLNKMLPVLMGWLTGLPKKLGSISRSSTQFIVKEAKADVFHGTYQSLGGLQPASSFPNFQNMRALFEQVHIGRLFYASDDMIPLTAPFICVPMDLQLDDAQIEPVSADITVTNRFFPPYPNSIVLNGIDTDPLGAFRLHCSWRMSPPNTC